MPILTFMNPRCAVILGFCLLPGLQHAGAITINADTGPSDLISVNTDWKLFRGDRAPSSPDAAWREVAFDDAQWETQPSGFGYSDGDDTTVLDDMEDNYLTVYIRRQFSVDGVPPDLPLQLIIDWDDGFVAYLNGTEVARRNMPAGEPTFQTEATPNHEAGTPEIINLGSAASLLNTGVNVLAIEGHNGTIGSSDFSLIPALRIAADAVSNDGTLIVQSLQIGFNGVVASALTTRVRLAGSTVSYDSANQSWQGTADLVPGLNTLVVEALDASDNILESAAIDVVNVPAANEISGTISSDTTIAGAALLDGTVTVADGVTLSIDPGTWMLMRPGASLFVQGKLVAAGTAQAPIRFTHYGDGTNWERIVLSDADDSILSHCVIEYSDCEGDHKDFYDDDCDESTPPPGNRNYFQAVVAVATNLEIAHCAFQNLPDGSNDAEGDAIAIISDDPDVPGDATSHIHDCTFIGIGQGVHTRYSYVLIEDCFFTGHNGDNDDIDLYGESVPVPLVRKNIMIDPGHDDMINPTRCSALIIGNIIAGSDDHGIVLRDKCRPVLINNLIYNCSAAGVSVQNQCDALLINNTIVDCGRGVRLFDHNNRWDPPYCLFPGSGKVTLINCIIRDCPTTFELADSPSAEQPGSEVTVEHCNIEGGTAAADVSNNSTLTYDASNFDSNPEFLDLGNDDYRLLNGSTSIDAGTLAHPAMASYLEYLTTDFDGNPRVSDGNGDGTATIDLGAFEYAPPVIDSNGDGVPDTWYTQYGLDGTNPGVGSGDPDHDGVSTQQEFFADTDPVDPNSRFQIQSISESPSGTGIQIPSSALRVYTLLSSTDLVTWTASSGLPPAPGNGTMLTLSWPGPTPGARRFFKVQVEVP